MIVVTGAGGMIGARFVEMCNGLGVPLVSVDKPASFQRVEHRGLDFGTIIPMDDLQDWLDFKNPNIHAIVHMGACSDTTETNVSLMEKVNCDYSKKLWSYCLYSKTPFFYASSASTYGDGSSGYGDEESRLAELEPLNLYAKSKHEFDRWALAREELGMAPPRWAGFKFFNVYGFGEAHKGHMSSLVYKAWKTIKSGEPVTLFKSHKEGVADGHQARDFIYVDDIIEVLYWAMNGVDRGIYNVGTGQASTFLALVHAVYTSMQVEPNIEWVDTPENIRKQYQYFTQAEMGKLREAGFTRKFAPIGEGVDAYVRRLES